MPLADHERPAARIWSDLRKAVATARATAGKGEAACSRAQVEAEAAHKSLQESLEKETAVLVERRTQTMEALEARLSKEDKERRTRADSQAEDLNDRLTKLLKSSSDLELQLRRTGWGHAVRQANDLQILPPLPANSVEDIERHLDEAEQLVPAIQDLSVQTSGPDIVKLKNREQKPVSRFRKLISRSISDLADTAQGNPIADQIPELYSRLRVMSSQLSEQIALLLLDSELDLDEVAAQEKSAGENERQQVEQAFADAQRALEERLAAEGEGVEARLATAERVRTLAANAAAQALQQAEDPQGAKGWCAGQLRERIADRQVALSLHIEPTRSLPLIIRSRSAEGRAQAVGAITGLIAHALQAFPAGKLQLAVIDAQSLGQNVAPFIHLADFSSALLSEKVMTERLEGERLVSGLAEHAAMIIQKYLRSDFADIAAFNAQAGEIAEPYRLLVVLDAPAGLSEEAAERLETLLANGRRSGVLTVLHQDGSRKMPRGLDGDLAEIAILVREEADGFHLEDGILGACQLQLSAPPSTAELHELVERVGREAERASAVEIAYRDVERTAGIRAYWTESSANGLSVPLGPTGANRLRHLVLGRGTSQHVLMAGKTGSGKSTLLHVIITGLVLRYSPEELQLYLIDFKKGVEFKPYVTFGVPHLKVVAIESEREFGLSVLQGLDELLKQRGELFRACGADDVRSYRERTGELLPRIVLLVDEFQEFFAEDDAIAARISQILDRLVRQGRAFGVHVLMGSQTLAGTYMLARSSLEQMAVRIALPCSEADSRLILSEDNSAGRSLSRPGAAIYNDRNGLVEGNEPFQVAWLSKEEHERYLKAIAAREPASQRAPVVFEGSAPATLQTAPFLSRLRHGQVQPGEALLGQPISVADACGVRFLPQSGSHLMIVGMNEEAARAIFMSSLYSLAANPLCSGRIVLFDLALRGQGNGDFSALQTALGDRLELGGPRELGAALESWHKVLEESREQPTYLAIFGLQRARDIQPHDDFGGMAMPFQDETSGASPGQQIGDLLREGPEHRLHLLTWCDSAANLNRRLSAPTIREFEMRVLFQMSLQDSLALTDSPAASRLGLNRALFNSDETGRLETFKPYALPTAKELEELQG